MSERLTEAEAVAARRAHDVVNAAERECQEQRLLYLFGSGKAKDVLDKHIGAALVDIVKDRDAWRNAMQSWTPLGSEFTTPAACCAFVEMRRESEHRAKCEAAISRKQVAALEARVAELAAALLALQEEKPGNGG